MNSPGPQAVMPAFDSDAYRAAYRRINGTVVVGEGLADRHFRLLAALLPGDRQELLALGAMEARHATDFVGCGRNLGVKADVGLARRLLMPLHHQFMAAAADSDTVACLVIQCLIIECFAVAAYRLYLPVADAYALPITRRVLRDEAEHLSYGERWLGACFPEVAARVIRCSRRAVPVALAMLAELGPDLDTLGIDPLHLVADFALAFQGSLEAIGFEAADARRLVTRLACLPLTPAAVPAPAP
jgi:fatty aldehyde decarbonylase